MVEKRINQKVRDYILSFKDEIKNNIVQNKCYVKNKRELDTILQFMYDYQPLHLSSLDFQKRKRVKNIVPLHNRCCAYRTNHQQCTRRKKTTSEFCGTHIKGTPHGVITDIETKKFSEKKSVWVEDIKGIIYYIDADNNVYDPQHKENQYLVVRYNENENSINYLLIF